MRSHCLLGQTKAVGQQTLLPICAIPKSVPDYCRPSVLIVGISDKDDIEKKVEVMRLDKRSLIFKVHLVDFHGTRLHTPAHTCTHHILPLYM